MQPPDDERPFGDEHQVLDERESGVTLADEILETEADAGQSSEASATQSREAVVARRAWWPWVAGIGAFAWGLGWIFHLQSPQGDLPPAIVAAEPATPEIVEDKVEVAEAFDAAREHAEAEAAVGAEANAEIPELSPWLSPKDLHDPNVVTYTLRFGGSLEHVANLFKIYHHEITALNPGLSLKKTLPADSKIVLYRRDSKNKSESVGYPDEGSLQGAVPMVEGPGRKLLALGWKRWATASTVATLDQVLRRWAERPQSDQPVLVGNMSARNGGKLPPHGSHRSGRDVDLGYIQKKGVYDELNWRAMDAHNLDAGATWELVRLLLGTGQVEAIFVDRAIQKLLYEHALTAKIYNKNQLARLIEYPRPTGSSDALIVHVNGHVDHLHVRLDCPPEQTKCKSRPKQDR